MTVLGNPVSGNFIEVEIQGAAGQAVRLDLRDTGGRPLTEHVIENAKTVERLSIPVHQRAAGLYLLHVASGSGRAVLKVLKP
ncbi:T9SS type A sorting domain-containing protein [Larkinella sp.]|uniref:T9SS type A sorting domain-containing protein n=1 Tax=Larkinella sp. TaxID=2034517 RepID=UPI003BA9B17A